MVECYRKGSDPQHLSQAKKCSFPKILIAEAFAIYSNILSSTCQYSAFCTNTSDEKVLLSRSCCWFQRTARGGNKNHCIYYDTNAKLIEI